MSFLPSPSLIEALLADLVWVVRAVQGVVGTVQLAGRLETALAHLAQRRFQAGFLRVERLLAQFSAGRLAQRVSPVRVGSPGVRAGSAREAGLVLPREFGWLVALGGHHAAGHGAQLTALLARPEMVALLEATPQAGRALGPMCRALGISASVLRPGRVVVAPVAREKEPRVRKVRAKPAPVDFGRIPLPRGVLAAARRAGFGKRV